MQDKPGSIELLEALAAFLREEVAPKLVEMPTPGRK